MKYRLQAILFVFVAFMLGCNEYMIVGVLPDIAHDYHESLSKTGLAGDDLCDCLRNLHAADYIVR